MNWPFGKEVNTTAPFTQYITGFYRFVDDILVLWDGPEVAFMEMITQANKAHPTIKFTTETGGHCISFLDVTITIANGNISTSLYRKNTEKNYILLASSFHAPKIIRAIPKGQFIRARRITSVDDHYIKAVDTLKHRFLKRGYKPRNIENCVKEVGTIPRNELLKYKPKERKDIFPFVSQYNAQSKQIERIVHKFWPLLQQEKTLRGPLAKPPIFSYKKGRSLRDKLCPSEINPPRLKGATRFLGQPKMGTFACLNCNCCSSIIKGDTLRHPANGTQSQLRWAILEVISPLQRGGNPKKKILQREAYWIKKLDTMYPKGMNDRWSVKCFL
ncbi:hypothetical protein XELAEV_18042121mg [Xenopus laevis]|uniref:Helix-turn-helix domain-containing protein n=1 Tax=Xenopus laevis TaxID=8355 RepID=A0A974C477_XENLA|nr:hypothetical protein XELAEV_18042121mg [Xenopus laevis]